MNITPSAHLLGDDGRDPGCEGAFEVLDQYVEARRQGTQGEARFADFVAHIRNCAACREDTESLLSTLDDLEGFAP